jgi:hypothetical protein
MSIDWIPGVRITVEAGLLATVAGSGAWDTSTWDSAKWGPDDIWTDISAWVKSIQIDRRFARAIQAWEAGTASVQLKNEDGRFSSTNLSGPYVSAGMTMVRALRPIRITAVLTGSTAVWHLFRGLVWDWTDVTVQGHSVVTAQCQDIWSLLGGDGVDGLAPVGAGELSGARLHRILDAAGYDGGRDIHPGTMTLQATNLSDRPNDDLVAVAEAEGGAVFVDADGDIVGEHQYALTENARSTVVQAIFGDGHPSADAAEIPCTQMPLGWRSDLVRNVVSYTRTGGTPQVRADDVSRAMTGVDRRETKTELLVETDAQADQLAAWFLACRKDDEQTFKSVTAKWLDASRGPDIIAQAVARRVRDLVECRRRPDVGDAITRRCHISGVHHTIGPDPQTTWDLWSATPYQAFANSRWDLGKWGASETDPNAARWFY